MSQILKPRLESSRPLTALSFPWLDGLIFPIAMWLLSRLVIVIAIQLIAPAYSLPPAVYYQPPLDFVPGFIPTPSLELFAHWDAAWYRKIVTVGYDYADDGKWHSIAFFPLFPLIIRGVMSLGLPFTVAGLLVNNLAFLGAMILVYQWVKEKHGETAAKWSTAVLAWCPFSLYGTVIYTEGLFLLLSTAALRAFERRQYAWAALWGALTTATRVTGAVLLPTFLLIAWRERRPLIAYIVALAVGLGLLSFSVFCAIQFGDPLAFVHVQEAWTPSGRGINWRGWWRVFKSIWTFRPNAGENLIKVIMIFGGGALLWQLRSKLRPITVIYWFCSYGLIFMSGSVISLGRFAYAIVSLPIAMGVWLVPRPRIGYAILGLFGTLLVGFSIQFAWWYWVA